MQIQTHAHAHQIFVHFVLRFIKVNNKTFIFLCGIFKFKEFGKEGFGLYVQTY